MIKLRAAISSNMISLAVSLALSVAFFGGTSSADDLRILSASEIPAITKKIEEQYADPALSKPSKPTKDALLSMLGDMRDLGKTAQDSIIGNLDALQGSRKLAQQAIDRLRSKGISEDGITLRLVEASSVNVASGATGAELIDTTFELNSYLVSMKTPDLLRSANLAIAEAFAKSGNRKVATQYLRQMFVKGAGELDANTFERIANNLAEVIVEGDIAVLGDFVLSTQDHGKRELYLTAVAQNALNMAQSANTPSKRLERWKSLLSAGGDQKLLSDIVQSALEDGEDEFAAILSQANAKFADKLIVEATDRRIREGYALRALRLSRFVTASKEAKALNKQIAQVMSDAGYVAMADALYPGTSKEKSNPVAEITLSNEILALTDADDYQGAMARALELPANERASVASKIAIMRSGKGDLKGALEMIRAVKDHELRLYVFRKVAEARAAQLDTYGILGKPAERLSVKPRTASTEKEYQQILGVDFNWTASADQKDPALKFNFPRVNADSIRAKVPPITPGTSSMILARFNKRVGLSGASTTDDIGIFGANIREYLFEAQGSVVPAILMVDSGVHTLTDLMQTATEIGDKAIVAEGDAFRISIPIFVRPGATLVLSGLEAREYRLDTNSGAFIMNSGRLIISDTSLLAYDYAKGVPDYRTSEQQQSFRPFVTSWSGSQTEIANAELKNLGYFGGRSYGFTMVSDPAYVRDKTSNTQRPTGTIVDSTFENLLYGFYSYEAEDVVIVGNEYRDNITYGLDPHDRSHRLVMAYNTAYGSIEKHGGIISREVDDSLIVGNIAFANKGAGLMIERDSIGNIIYANTSFGNGGDGIAIYESPCNLVDSNHSFANGNAGVKVRNSWNVLVRSNRLTSNKGAGLEAAIADVSGVNTERERNLTSDPFFTYVELDARHNEVSGNRAGVAAKGASRITLEANTFHSQSPNTFSGDLKAYRAQLLRPGAERLEATATCLPLTPPSRACSLVTSGVLQPKVQAEPSADKSTKYCTDRPGSLQQKALSTKQAEVEAK